jgi:transposase
VRAPEEMSREELIAVVRAQAEQLTSMAGQVEQLLDTNTELAAKLARVEHLLSRNSQNSSSPPSRDGDPGRTPAPEKKRRDAGSGRSRGKQPGAAGSNLGWTEEPDQRRDRFPQGPCACGADLAGAADLGVVDRYQQHEIPLVAVTVTQFDQHAVRCGCGRVHTAQRPDGARKGVVGYGPNLQAWAVYLMVVQFLPVQRCVQLLESMTGAAPSVGFVHGMLARAARLLAAVDTRIRALVTLAYAVCCDETPLRVGPKKPRPGRKKAEKYLLVACTERWTYYQLGDRDLDTFKAFVLTDLAGTATVVVHDRYVNYDSAQVGTLVHQLCCAHLLRDLAGAAQVYPDAVWPGQVADALRGLIHQANLARAAGRQVIDPPVKDQLVYLFRQGVLVGLRDTDAAAGSRPGERKARLLLECLRDRPDDVLRFAHDLNVPPTSNQAERDLRPSKIQQNISGRLTSEQRTKDRYTILGYVSSAAKNGLNKMTVLREAMLGRPWLPPLPAGP